MKTRILSLSGLLVSIIGIVAGYYLFKIYACPASVACYYLDIRAAALYYGSAALAIVFAILIFLPRATNVWWKRFGIWYIPLAVLLFATYTGPTSGDLFSPYPKQVFAWVSILYVIVSLAIIVISSSKARNK